jgi:hypothetical protein
LAAVATPPGLFCASSTGMNRGSPAQCWMIFCGVESVDPSSTTNTSMSFRVCAATLSRHCSM